MIADLETSKEPSEATFTLRIYTFSDFEFLNQKSLRFL